MDLKTLEAFLTLVDHLNFTKSAERLLISQPAFSRQIGRLEEELGCDLFLRNTRGVALTECGRASVDHAYRILAEYRDWQSSLDGIRRGGASRLRIDYLQDLPDEVFSRIVRSFRASRPGVELCFEDGPMTAIIDDLARGACDLGFTLSTEARESSGVEHLSLSRMPQCAALPDSHPLAGRAGLRLSELSSEPFVLVSSRGYSPGARHFLYLCRQAGFEPAVAAEVSSIPSLLTLVRCGVGTAIVAQAARDIAPEGLRFVPIEDEGTGIESMLLWRRDNENPALASFLEQARKTLAT